MDEKARRILNIVTNQGPIKASDIARLTGMERREVNQYLYYRLKAYCEQKADPRI